ncbi:MAG: hypothetical protein IPK76_15375 [Lewinellaceae bacterium]|nr:hypothetical protein [Lewinellaceae bacterium]
MHQLPLFLSFFLVPAFLPAQTNDGELHDMDVQVEESSVDPATAIKQSIPARLKTGKPELFAYQGRYGYVLNDSILIQPEYTALEKPYSDFMIARDSRNYFGVLNKKGEAVLPFEFYGLTRTAADLVLAGQKGTWLWAIGCKGQGSAANGVPARSQIQRFYCGVPQSGLAKNHQNSRCKRYSGYPGSRF